MTPWLAGPHRCYPRDPPGWFAGLCRIGAKWQTGFAALTLCVGWDAACPWWRPGVKFWTRTVGLAHAAETYIHIGPVGVWLIGARRAARKETP